MQWRRVALMALASAAIGCDYGRGSRPYDENTRASSAGTWPGLHVTGCVVDRDGVLALQATRPDEDLPVSLRQSTAANGPWVGTRSFVFADPDQLRGRVGSMVTVTGDATVPHARAAGVDQLAVQEGAIFPVLTVSRVDPANGSCAAAVRR